MAKLRFSRLAGLDLDDIRRISEADHGAAATFHHFQGFERVFDLLRRHPFAGQERPEIGKGVRTLSHRPHRLLYRIEEGDVIILRIVHAARDTGSLPGLDT